MEVLGDTLTSSFPELAVRDVSRAFSANTSLRLVDVLIRDPSKVFIAENSRRSRSWFSIMQQPRAACVVLHADNFLALSASQVVSVGLAAHLRRFIREDAASEPCCVCLETKATAGTCTRCLANICLACERELARRSGQVITIDTFSVSVLKCPHCSHHMPVAST